MKTDEHSSQRKSNAAAFFKSFFATLLIIIPVFLIVYNTNTAKKEQLDKNATTQTGEVTNDVPINPAKNYNLLFAVSETQTNNLLSVTVIRFDVKNYRILICDIPYRTVLLYLQNPIAINELYGQRGMTGVNAALQETLQIPISGYILIKTDPLSDLIDHMGEVYYTLDKPLQVESEGLTVYSKAAGSSRFKGNDVVKLLIYGQYNELNRTKMHEDLWVSVFSAYADSSLSGRLAGVYTDFVNRMETDISTMDVSSITRAVDAVCTPTGTEVAKIRLRGNYVGDRFQLSEGADQELWVSFDHLAV